MRDLFDEGTAREIILRNYQKDAIEALRDCIRKGIRRIILCAGTGAGKTLTSASLLQDADRKGRYCLFLVDRVSLVNQTSDVFEEYGIRHGVLQGTAARPIGSACVLSSCGGTNTPARYAGRCSEAARPTGPAPSCVPLWWITSSRMNGRAYLLTPPQRWEICGVSVIPAMGRLSAASRINTGEQTIGKLCDMTSWDMQ